MRHHAPTKAALSDGISGRTVSYGELVDEIRTAAAGLADLPSLMFTMSRLYGPDKELEVPSPQKYGISEQQHMEAIPTMAAQALASGSPQAIRAFRPPRKSRSCITTSGRRFALRRPREASDVYR